MAKIKVFLDTDVIISALISQKGASSEIIKNKILSQIISKTVKKESYEVCRRKNFNQKKLKQILKKLKTTSLNLSKVKLVKNYSLFVNDIEDTHVIAATFLSKSRFLLTHNKKHYKVIKIKNNLDIIVLKPGEFLQYLRSRS